MELDMKMEPSNVLLHGRLVERHDVRERLPPEIVEANDDVAEHSREIPSLLIAQAVDGGHAAQWRDVRLIGIACEVRDERDGASMLRNDPSPVLTLGRNDVLEQRFARLFEMPAARTEFGLNVFESEVRGVDLTVRVRVADADNLSLVLEDEDEVHFGMRGQFAPLLLPRREQRIDAVDIELRQREVVAGAVAHHSRDARGRAISIDADRRRQVTRGIDADTRVIVIEHECAGIRRIDRAAHSRVARAEIARRIEGWRRLRLTRYFGARPRPRLPVCCDDDPFFAQRMPPLLPHATNVSGSASSTRRWHASERCR